MKLATLLDLPENAIGIMIVATDSEVSFGFADGPFVRDRIQAHSVLLSEGVVVFQSERAAVLIKDSRNFHQLEDSALDAAAILDRNSATRRLLSLVCG